MKEVWILHYDVEYELGNVLSVHASEDSAVSAARADMKEDRVTIWNDPYTESADRGGAWVESGRCWSVYPYEVES